MNWGVFLLIVAGGVMLFVIREAFIEYWIAAADPDDERTLLPTVVCADCGEVIRPGSSHRVESLCDRFIDVRLAQTRRHEIDWRDRILKRQ